MGNTPSSLQIKKSPEPQRKDQKIKDQFGNQLTFRKSGWVELFLKRNKETRKLGYLRQERVTRQHIFFSPRNEKRHTFKALDAWGVNHNLLQRLDKFPGETLFVITTELGKYRLPVKVIKEKGQFQHHKEPGFELQLFVPKSEWTFIKMKKKRKGRP